MENGQISNPQPGRIERLIAIWHALDKKKWGMLGGVLLTIGALVVVGLSKGVPWFMAHE